MTTTLAEHAPATLAAFRRALAITTMGRRFQVFQPSARCQDCPRVDSATGKSRRAEQEAKGHHLAYGHTVWADQVERRVVIYSLREPEEVADCG